MCYYVVLLLNYIGQFYCSFEFYSVFFVLFLLKDCGCLVLCQVAKLNVLIDFFLLKHALYKMSENILFAIQKSQTLEMSEI